MSFFLDSLSVLVIGIILVVIILPIMIVVVIIFGIILFFALRRYMRTAVEIRRLVQLTVSPMLNKVSETIGGVVSIRAYDKIDWMRDKFNKAIDLNNNC